VYPGRVLLGVGTGESMNEVPVELSGTHILPRLRTRFA